MTSHLSPPSVSAGLHKSPEPGLWAFGNGHFPQGIPKRKRAGNQPARAMPPHPNGGGE